MRGVIGDARRRGVRRAQERFGKGKVDDRRAGALGPGEPALDQKKLARWVSGVGCARSATTCRPHGLDLGRRVHTWDGKKWSSVPDWYQADEQIIKPLVKAAADKYAAERRVPLIRGAPGGLPVLPAQGRFNPAMQRFAPSALSGRRPHEHPCGPRGSCILGFERTTTIEVKEISQRQPSRSSTTTSWCSKGVSLAGAEEGGIVAMLGGNGAGKTTTLRAVQPAGRRARRGDQGLIELRGERIENLARPTWSSAAWCR